MKRSILLLITLSALLFGEQKLLVETTQDSLQVQSDTVQDPLPVQNKSTENSPKLLLDTPQDSLTIEPLQQPRTYNYRYQIVSGVAMMLFFGIMLGATQSLNPK